MTVRETGQPFLGVRELDWLLGAVVFLCCLGLVMAVTIGGPRDAGPLLALKGQGAKILVGLVVFLAAATIRLSWLRRMAVPMLAVGLLLVLATQFFPATKGATRWIKFGPYSFQPVELARFTLIVYLAAWVGRAGDAISEFRRGFLPMVMPAGVLTLLLLIQPDVGNAAFTLCLAVAMAIVGGARIWQFALAAVPMLGLMAMFGSQYGHVRERLMGFLEIERGSQVWQSLVSISSGGWFGTGLGEGWMKMGFVPEASNDFVFAVVGEELGFAGAGVVVCLYGVIGFVGVRLITQMRDPFLRMLVFGLTFAICMQAAINLLVVTGMAPAKGIDLPFLSSGGTNLVFSLGAIGIIGNAARTDLCRQEE